MHMVEGRNTWFLSDLSCLSVLWPEGGRNQESTAELWLGLLRYFTEEFNFDENVICVRSLKPLTRFEKLWNGKCIAIEDPFDLGHNLGAALSRKMNMYIMQCLRRGRELFGTPISQLPPRFGSLMMYLFDTAKLTDGAAPPSERTCNVCGRIGHWQRDCPIDRIQKGQARREAQRQEREQAKQQGRSGGEAQRQEQGKNRSAGDGVKPLMDVSVNTPARKQQERKPRHYSEGQAEEPHHKMPHRQYRTTSLF